ncbi:hypothetical protein [Vibrio mediterranei]|nr:hypothetical protein [Vibrio mediterranei]
MLVSLGEPGLQNLDAVQDCTAQLIGFVSLAKQGDSRRGACEIKHGFRSH